MGGVAVGFRGVGGSRLRLAFFGPVMSELVCDRDPRQSTEKCTAEWVLVATV